MVCTPVQGGPSQECVMEDVSNILRFLDMMTGDWAWIPVAAATFIVALIMDFIQKIKGEH